MTYRSPATAARHPGTPVRRVLVAMSLTVCAVVVSTAWAQQPPSAAPSAAAPMAPQGPRGDGNQGPRGMHGTYGTHGMHGAHGMHDAHGMHGMHGMREGGARGEGGAHAFGPRLLHGSPERIGRMVDRMLDGLGASDAQRVQVKEIAIRAAADVRAQMQAGRGLRQKGAEALLAPQVDPAAVEAVRQQMLQQHDQVSRRVSQAMLDIARVLTPEQRAKAQARLRDLQARMDDRRQRMEQRMQQRWQERAQRPAASAPR